MHSVAGVALVKFHLQVTEATPVVGDDVVLIQDSHELIGVLFPGVLHANIIHTKGKGDGPPFVRLQPGNEGDLAEPLFVQVLLK